MLFKEKYPRKFDSRQIELLIKELVSQDWLYTGIGSDLEPFSTKWCEALSTGMGNYFKEGMCVIDWGCGYGRYYNWLSSQLLDFKYYGFEPKGERNGDLLIKICKKKYGNQNKNAIFGFIEDNYLVENAIENSSIVLLGSVFTHLPIEHAEEIIKKFKKILDNNGCIVFSIILSDKYLCLGDNAYGLKNTYAITKYTMQNLEKLSTGYQLIKCAQFITPDKTVHDIFRLEK